MKKIFSARNFFILLAAACIVVIFMFSTENSGESSERSGGLAYIAVRLLHRNYNSLPKCEQKTLLGSADHIVRKLAHFSIYAFLGACISFAAGRRKLLSRGTFIALFLSSAYACTDELHQHFVHLLLPLKRFMISIGHSSLVALKFKIVIIAKDALVPLNSLACALDVTVHDQLRHFTAEACRAANDSLVMSRQLIVVGSRMAVQPLGPRLRHNRHQSVITF